MLQLTEGAAAMIRELLDRPELPSGTGLRITQEQPEVDPSFALKAAIAPRFGDEVVEDKGVRVFLGPNAATLLADKVLDANVDARGQVHFQLSPQK